MRFARSRITQSLIWVILPVTLLVSCAPSGGPKVSVEKPAGVAPSDLTATVDHNQAEFIWRTNRGGALIQGYNLYLSESPVVDEAGKLFSNRVPYNDEVYPGDIDPAIDTESIRVKELEDGRYYYAAVTIVFADGSESAPSNQIRFVCYPEGEFTLSRSYSGEHDGFSFEREEYVATDDFDNFLYYTQIKGTDYLLSPSRLDDVLKSVEFCASNIQSIDDSADFESGSWSDKISIKSGSSCLMRTESGQFAKIRVLDFYGSGDDRKVRIEYRFMPMPGNTDF